MILKSLACLFLTLIYVSTVVSQQDATFIQTLEAEIEQKIANQEIPSIAFAISKDGNIIYQGAYGWADIERQIPATMHTSYQIASVSKPMTATGIMLLQAQQKLHIDDDAQDYMGDLSFQQAIDQEANVHIRHLLNHTSGLGTYFDIYYEDEQVPPIHFVEAFETYGVLHHPAGVISEYSNLGYGLLDHIITQNSGRTYGQFMQEELFAPLGMRDTYVQGSANEHPRIQEAQKYTADMQALPTITNNTVGAGNIFSSVADLITFGHFYLGVHQPAQNILSHTSISEMWSFQAPNTLYHYHSDTYYGLGWYVKPHDHGYRVVWHEGGMMGASSTLKMIPDEHIVIAVVINANNRSFCNYVVDQLSQQVLPGYTPTPLNESTEIQDYQPFTVDSTYIGKWSGAISVDSLNIPFSLTFDANGSVRADYVDYTYQSYFTQANPLPNNEELLMALTNQQSFIGLFLGELPSNQLRNEYSHLLSLKLVKTDNQLVGTIVALPAAEREYYAYPYHVVLTKAQDK